MRANKPTEEKRFENPNEPANEKAAPEAIASGATFYSTVLY
ncbi:MAG: hypothetical protein ACLU62_10270 [Hydrogeniiclostridium sp.]